MNIILPLVAVISCVLLAPAVEGSSCDVIPIERWGSSPSGYLRDLPKPVELVVVTHTVTSGCDTDESCERISKAIRNTHRQQGFSDIRLSFLVGGNGKIYEGAGWKIGEHSGAYSGKSISLSFIGEFSNSLPTPAAQKAAEHFLGCFLNTRNLACEYGVVGHRQVMATLSPGDALQRLIQSWPHWTHTVPNV